MDLSKLENYREAAEILQANKSPRHRHLASLDAWANGRQYEGLDGWFTQDKPLWERAPCIVYLLAKEAVESKVDLVLGEGRFPEVTASPDEGDPLKASKDAKGDQAGLDEGPSRDLEALIDRIVKQSGFKAAAREALRHAQEVSSACLIFGVRAGKLFCDTTKAQWCEPTLDPEGRCTRLEIRYAYLEPSRDPQSKKWRVKAKLYRRVIDAKSDTTYKPVDANKDGDEPKVWPVDREQSFDHGLGFCPVVWYPFFRGCGTAGQIDGNAPHANLLDEIRALDFSLSQRHRAALFAGDPQWSETGVEPGFNPSEGGRTAIVPGTPQGGDVTDANPVTTHWEYPKTNLPARVKSPGGVWQYPNPDTKVELHCLPGDALKTLFDHAGDLRMKLCEMLAHVPLDPDSIKFAATLSGKAMESLRRRELNRCDQIRDDFGAGCLLPALSILVRIAAHFATRREAGALNLAGLDKVKATLATFVDGDPPLDLRWGSYTKPDPEDEAKIVATTIQAHDGGLITDHQALSKIKEIYGIDNVDEAVDNLREEKEERAQKALEQTTAEQKSLHDIVKNDGAGAPGQGQPKGAPPG